MAKEKESGGENDPKYRGRVTVTLSDSEQFVETVVFNASGGKDPFTVEMALPVEGPVSPYMRPVTPGDLELFITAVKAGGERSAILDALLASAGFTLAKMEESIQAARRELRRGESHPVYINMF